MAREINETSWRFLGYILSSFKSNENKVIWGSACKGAVQGFEGYGTVGTVGIGVRWVRYGG